MRWNLRERVDASDVVQEALVEVVRQFPQFTGSTEADLVGWMRRLVGQRLADLGRHFSRLKRGAGQRQVSLDVPHDADGRHPAEGPFRLADGRSHEQPSPSEVSSRRELTGLLTDALSRLPAAEAEVLRLYHAEGLSFEAIGARLGLGRKSVRMIWARGLKSLRATIAGPPGGRLRYDAGRCAPGHFAAVKQAR